MGAISQSIGLRWEKVLHEQFPELVSTVNDLNVPDFYHNSGFWVEAKVGNQQWGPRIKEYQIECFMDFPEPIIYAFGFHNFDNAFQRLTQRTERGRQKCLEAEMSFVERVLVDKEIVEKIWRKESKWNERETIQYCMIKGSLLRNIFLDRPFKRQGTNVDSSEEFYGFRREDFFIVHPSVGSYGLMLRREGSENVMSYLSEKGVIRN